MLFCIYYKIRKQKYQEKVLSILPKEDFLQSIYVETLYIIEYIGTLFILA